MNRVPILLIPFVNMTYTAAGLPGGIATTYERAVATPPVDCPAIFLYLVSFGYKAVTQHKQQGVLMVLIYKCPDASV